MRLVQVILVLALSAGLGTAPLRGQENAATSQSPLASAQVESVQPESEAPKPEGLSAKATEVFRVGSFPVTNSMIVTWIVALGAIAFAQVATRRMKEVPDGLQNFWEWLVESLYNFLEVVLGASMVKKTFWFLATIFIFILATNWFGLLPGVGTIGWGEIGGHGFEVTRPLLRAGNADLNMPLAMAMIFFLLWIFWSLQANGVKGFFLHIFGPKGNITGLLGFALMVIFFAVGFIEVISICFRPIALTFRLYGNMFAGETLLEVMRSTVQHPAWARTVFSALLPVPFYFMELLVGLVQSLVFMLLCAVFTAVICVHEEGTGEDAHH